MYLNIRAARYLGVPPWELMKQPLYWRQWALAVQEAEEEVEAEREARKWGAR